MTGSGRILIVDDEKAFLQTTAELLRRSGYTCTCAQDANTALLLLEDESYDLLISDIKMPGNQQLELIEQVAELTRGIPVILMTAYPALESAIQAIQLPVVAYLVKPFRFRELLAEVRNALAPAKLQQLGKPERQAQQVEVIETNPLVERNQLQEYRLPQKRSPESLAQLLNNAIDSLTTLQELTTLLIQEQTGRGALDVQQEPNFETIHKTNGNAQGMNFLLSRVPAEVLNTLRHLSRREREILRLLLENHRLRTVAKTLYISPHTARNHLHAVFRKFSVHSQEELLERLASYPVIKEWL